MTDEQQLKPVIHVFWRAVNPFIGPFNARSRMHRRIIKARRAERGAQIGKNLSARAYAKECRKNGTLK